MILVERTPIEALWAAVKMQTGWARSWHINDLYNHELRYLADLRLIEALPPAARSWRSVRRLAT